MDEPAIIEAVERRSAVVTRADPLDTDSPRTRFAVQRGSAIAARAD